MIDPEDELREVVVGICRRWLTFHPDGSTYKVDVPAVRFPGESGPVSKAASLPANERLGPFRPALREAELHWAASKLPDLHRVGARLRRSKQRNYDVWRGLSDAHPEGWRAWLESHELTHHTFKAIQALMQECAEMMADSLGNESFLAARTSAV